MQLVIHRQLEPFYETMMLLAYSDDLSQTRTATVEAINAMGLDGEKIYQSHMPIYERYVKAFNSHKKGAPENAFWMNIEGEQLLAALLNLIWVFREYKSSKPKAEETQSVLVDIFSESDLKIDLQMIQSSRPDIMMAAIDNTEMSSKDKWVLLQILLKPEDTVRNVHQWVELNIEAFRKAYSEVEPEFKSLLGKFTSFIEQKNNHFRGILEGLASVKEVYPSLASPLNQIAFSETAFCGMLTYVLENSGSIDAVNTDLLRVGWKALADKSKMEILLLLKDNPMYNQAIAQKLGLTAATVSYHMNALLACHFVTISKSDGRVYYQLKTQDIDAFFKKTRDMLLE